MGAKSKIGWTNDTANPWTGCEPCSPGCKNCYAETFVEGRLKRDFKKRITTKNAIKNLLAWNKRPWVCACEEAYENNRVVAQKDGIPVCGKCMTPRHRRRVFVGSMMDWLDEKAPIEQFVALLDTIRVCTNLDFLLLTKRPENWNKQLTVAMALVDDDWFHGKVEQRPALGDWIGRWIEAQYPHRGIGQIPPNVWFGVTVEDQKRADERIPLLLDIPAKVKFLSCEPLLEAVNLEMALEAFNTFTPDLSRAKAPIDWIIVGGESGPGARPFNVDWARDVVRQCKAAGVACFVKQMGSRPVDRNDAGFEGDKGDGWPMDTHTIDDVEPGVYQGKPVRIKLKHTKGEDPAEWPEDLRVQQWPEVAR